MMTIDEALADAIKRLVEFHETYCYCDNTHEQNNTKCLLCLYREALVCYQAKQRGATHAGRSKDSACLNQFFRQLTGYHPVEKCWWNEERGEFTPWEKTGYSYFPEYTEVIR